MSYALVQDIPASWDTYLGIADALGASAPEGLVIHAAGPTEEGFRMIGIWDNRESWDRFQTERLGAIFDGLGGGTRIQPRYRELNIVHLLPDLPTLRTPKTPSAQDMTPTGPTPR
jgi:hypothetical protein